MMIPSLKELGVPVFSGYSIPQWFSFIHAADYVISADTSTFHYAGGIKKPLVGIFTHADGKYRGQYYDFILVQKHRDDGNWPCGPCYNYAMCTHPKGKDCKNFNEPRPCLTELTVSDIIKGIEKMFKKWSK
jgi:ADP-heptose:LPS heptosyltransferase